MLLITAAAPLLTEMKMIFTWWGQTWALWHIPPIGMGGCLCPQAPDRSNGAEGDHPCLRLNSHLGSPLGSTSDPKREFVHFTDSSAAVHHLNWMSLIRDRTQVSSKWTQLQAIILALEDTLANNRSHLHFFFYRLLGHCQWSGRLVWPMATIPYPRLSIWVKELWEFIASQIPEI